MFSSIAVVSNLQSQNSPELTKFSTSQHWSSIAESQSAYLFQIAAFIISNGNFTHLSHRLLIASQPTYFLVLTPSQALHFIVLSQIPTANDSTSMSTLLAYSLKLHLPVLACLAKNQTFNSLEAKNNVPSLLFNSFLFYFKPVNLPT